MAEHLLFDTDVLIDYLRGEPTAATYLEPLTAELLLSAVSVAELYSGVREGRERTELDGFLSVFGIVPVDRETAVDAGLLRRQFRKSHGVGLPDALIAATAIRLKVPLVTLNRKHYPMLDLLIVPYVKP